MAKQRYDLASMTVDALLKLRDDIGTVLSRKSGELKSQLQRLERGVSASSGRHGNSGRPNPRKGLRVPPKYRGPGGETWAGRGATPRWLSALLRQGKRREDFLIERSAEAATARKRSKTR